VSQQTPEAFHRVSEQERRTLLDIFRLETTGGFLLLAGAAIALIWANLSPESYKEVTSFTIGPEALNLNLSLSTWAKDGLLAIFFLVVGLELKREFISGDLRNPTEAIVPMVWVPTATCADGRSPPPPTSRSPSLFWPSSARGCPRRFARSC
jgi:NhaA family Na+:H+ antiporter